MLWSISDVLHQCLSDHIRIWYVVLCFSSFLATFIYLGFVFQMAYIAFLATFTYVVLVKTLPVPRVQEYYVMAYILTAAIEKVREVRFTYVQ